MKDEQLEVELGDRSYPVCFRNGARRELTERTSAFANTGRVLVISDSTVAELYAAEWCADLRATGLDAHLLSFPAGEANKTLDVVRGLYDQAFDLGADRRTPIVAFGGGVVGDVGGFVAATLFRGVPFAQVPTTVLSQVDSSVGGKTGVNHPAGKNLIGAFHQPSWVMADVEYLATLAPREVRSGLAEVVKHAALARPDLLEQITASGEALRAAEPEALRAVIAPAVAVKAEVVAADEREAGQRAVLNLGHTLGHAIEAEAGYGTLTHGEAVALGTRFAAELSRRRGWLDDDELTRLDLALDACGLPADYRAWLRPEVLRRVSMDKKVRGQSVNFVFLEGLGSPRIVPLALDALAAEATSLVREDT